MEKTYVQAMDEAKKAYEIIAAELPEEAQYVVPMAYHVHWYFQVNLPRFAVAMRTPLSSSGPSHPIDTSRKKWRPRSGKQRPHLRDS